MHSGHPLQAEYSIIMKISFLILIMLTQTMLTNAQPEALNSMKKNILIFVNGYRGFGQNNYQIDHKVIIEEKVDSNKNYIRNNPYVIGYWRVGGKKYDLDIKNRFTNADLIYFDGHHKLSASNHKNLLTLIGSFLKSKLFFFLKDGKFIFRWKINKNGYKKRFDGGIAASENLDLYLKKYNTQDVIIHVVSHSMGFAYSLGLVEALKDKYTFGKMLSISPESAAFREVPCNVFTDVFQYGCDMDSKSNLVIYQDGIAPQQKIRLKEDCQNARLIFVSPPSSWPNKNRGFNKSHHLNWFQWFYSFEENSKEFFKE